MRQKKNQEKRPSLSARSVGRRLVSWLTMARNRLKQKAPKVVEEEEEDIVKG